MKSVDFSKTSTVTAFFSNMYQVPNILIYHINVHQKCFLPFEDSDVFKYLLDQITNILYTYNKYGLITSENMGICSNAIASLFEISIEDVSTFIENYCTILNKYFGDKLEYVEKYSYNRAINDLYYLAYPVFKEQDDPIVPVIVITYKFPGSYWIKVNESFYNQ